mgnify:CR=1 FL=1
MIMSLSVFLLTGLPTSSFFLSKYLTQLINENEHNDTQLAFAIEKENLTALNFAWKNSKLHDVQWLKFAKTLAKSQGEAAFQLAIYYQSNPTNAIFWYKSAIRLHYPEASTALALLYFQQGNLVTASEILDALSIESLDKLSDEAIILKVNIAINQGRVADVQKLIIEYAQQLESSKEGRALLDDIQKYQIPFNDNQALELSLVAMSCENSIQLFATSVNHLKHLENLIADFSQQALNESVCFSPVRYIPIDSLDCTNEKDENIQCNEVNWQPWANSVHTRYVGIMLPQGGANVHFGVLYFDAEDSVDVVAHEISHLLGFVDEYPLVAEHVKCRAIQDDVFSQNISVLKNSYKGNRTAIRASLLKQIAWAKHISNNTPILQSIENINGEHYWKLGTPEEFKDETGVFYAQTCNNSTFKLKNGFSAFKPISRRTKLQYSALSFPQLYSELLKDNLNQHTMPSFHYNIALAYFQKIPFQQKNIEEAKYWLDQAASKEQDFDRRKKIRQGGF